MESNHQPTLWAQDLEAIVEMAIEQGLSFPLAITLTAPDGSVCSGELKEKGSCLAPNCVAQCAEQWELEVPIRVTISDRQRRNFEARVVGGAIEPSGHC